MSTKHGDLLRRIAAYCTRANIAPSTFGRMAINDGKLVTRLEAGRRLWPETEAKVRRFMEANPLPSRSRTRARQGAEAA